MHHLTACKPDLRHIGREVRLGHDYLFSRFQNRPQSGDQGTHTPMGHKHVGRVELNSSDILYI